MDTGLTSLALGSRATLVARAIAANTESGTEMMGLCPEQRFLVDAHIDQDTLVTIYNAELSAAGPLPRLHLDNHAGWIAHLKPTHGAFFQLKELCAGLGGFSQGANFVGIKTVACLDHSRLACDALRLQGHEVVHAQMEDMEALFKFHQIGLAQPCLLSAGFPCQPYSAQGDQQGMRDSRGQTLISILKASWYLQSVGLILECVHNARHNVDVQNLLAQYANLRRWQVHHVTLDLQDQWASKRKRWWCIMIPKDSRVPFSMHPWPSTNPFPNVGSVIQEWPVWSNADESNLQWTSEEEQKYGDPQHALCLIGQLAAPLQAVWVFGHIVNWVIHINTGRPKRSPVGMIQEYQHKLLQDRLLCWTTPSMFMPRTLTLTEDGEPDALITLDKPTTLAQLKKAETSLQGWGAAIRVYPAGYNKTDNELITSATDRLECAVSRSTKRQVRNYYETASSTRLRAAGLATADQTWDDLAVLTNIHNLINYNACLDPRPWTVITPHQAHALLGNTTVHSRVHDDIRVPHTDRLVIIFPCNQHWTLLTCEQETVAQLLLPTLGGTSNCGTTLLKPTSDDGTTPSPRLASLVNSEQDRTDQAIAKLGTGPIQKALFRWILYDELQDHIASRASSEHGAYIPAAKNKKAKQGYKPHNQPELHVDPNQLIVPDGIFTDDEDNKISQIPLAEVSANKRGFAITTVADAMHFINDAQSISTDALAIITTSELPTQPTVQQAETIRFPAVYTGTNEPVLLTGSLIQIGDMTVKRVTKSAEPLQDEIATATIRVSVFADECPHDWQAFVKAPIKSIVKNTPLLQKCPEASCSGRCGKFHPAIEEPVDYVIQDVWAWTYASADGKRTAIEHCVLFHAHIRVPESASPLLQTVSGNNGTYFDPRAPDGRAIDPRYTVIWLPGANIQDAKHRARTCDSALAITRLGNKFGIRVQEQVIVTKVKDVGPKSSSSSTLCATGRTRKHIQQGATSNPTTAGPQQDPWLLGGDPWAKWHHASGDITMSPVVPQQSATSSKKIDQLGTALKQDMQEAIRTEVAKNADASKLMQLEVSVQELRDQGKRFENWFHEVSQHGQKQGEDLKLLQQVVTQQQGDLTEVKQQIRSQGDALQAAVGNIKHDLSSQIDTQFQRFEELLAVGTTNPSGLNGKEDLQIQQGPGIWHLAETQLSHVTGPIVRRKLAQLGRAQQRQVRCIEGAPAPLRAHSHWAGSWTGVLIATDLPARPLTLPWDAGVFETGRVTTARHIFDGVPITTTAVYGFPPGPTYPDARALTDRLLATITREIVVGLQGVRVVAGDFNHDESTLPQIALWKQHGWVEAQQLALALWQQQPQPTCKGATQRDLIFLSPEAAALTQRVRIKDVYMEHSSVIVDLWTKAQQQQIRRWRQPAAIPWGSINIPGWHSASLA
ncbi:unnamed protein product [Effrenium voratum]|uniref:DNA (cytosine-5-)-methyltransferase n=1 Tax=Effrenium voratum TaxID=2562239 RepID=A0AA36N249_9DINO|nr:unnamed protein product [Effrenium voratum]